MVRQEEYDYPRGKALFSMCGVFAEFERAMIQERVQAGLQELARKEKCSGRSRVGSRTRTLYLGHRACWVLLQQGSRTRGRRCHAVRERRFGDERTTRAVIARPAARLRVPVRSSRLFDTSIAISTGDELFLRVRAA